MSAERAEEGGTAAKMHIHRPRNSAGMAEGNWERLSPLKHAGTRSHAID